MNATAQLKVRVVKDANYSYEYKDIGSLRAADAYAIDIMLGNIDDNPNVYVEILDEHDQVLKTYTKEDIPKIITEREQKINKPKDNLYWDQRVKRNPSGKPSSLPDRYDISKEQLYKQGDIVEIFIDESSEWRSMSQIDKPIPKGGWLTYQKADQYLKSKNSDLVKLQYQTFLKRQGDFIMLLLHQTNIVTMNPDGTYIVFLGGWNTKLTRDRINTLTPMRISTMHGTPYIGGVAFDDHQEVLCDSEGRVIGLENTRTGEWEKIDRKEQHSRNGEIAEIAYVDNQRTKRAKEYVYAVIFLSDGEKGFYNQSNLAPVQIYGNQSEESEPVIAKRNAQELKNDTFNNETETPSANSTIEEGRTLEEIDRSQNVKNKIPGPWDGNRRASNPFHAFAQVKETGYVGHDMSDRDTAETGHIGSGDELDFGKGQRTPGALDNPSKNYPIAHDTSENSSHKQL